MAFKKKCKVSSFFVKKVLIIIKFNDIIKLKIKKGRRKNKMRKIKKKINWLKIGALLLMISEIIIAFRIGNQVKGDLVLWKIYTACILFIPVNLMIIFSKNK